MKTRRLAIAFPLALAAATALLGGCQHEPPEPFVKDVKIDVQAKIEAVDPSTRMVSLRGPNGPASILAGPEVQNFSQIRVGDEVHVTYYAGLAAKMVKKGSANGAPVEDNVVYTAPIGTRPAAGASSSVTTTVKIQSVDTTKNTVTFKRPDGFERTLDVMSADGQKFISSLRPGDEVEVVYTEAVAIAVVPGQG
jgi:hypothetical protein